MKVSKRYYLVKFREQSKLNQTQIAEKLHINRPYYVSIETNRCMPSFEIWLAIQKLLKIDDADMWKVITRVRSEDAIYGKKN